MTDYYYDPSDDDELDDDHGRISPIKVIILLFLVLVLVAITALPIIRQSIHYYNRPPTPTPFFMQEAQIYGADSTANPYSNNDQRQTTVDEGKPSLTLPSSVIRLSSG